MDSRFADRDHDPATSPGPRFPFRVRVAILALTLALAGTVAPPLAAGSIPVEGFDSLPRLEGLESRWGEIMDLFDTPGMTVAVVHGGRIHVASFGQRGTDAGVPVTPETMFYIASITKTFTAAGIQLLASEGKLDLDDLVRDHLPALTLPDPAVLDSLTIRDLLSHARGINSGPAVLLDAYTGEITEERYYHWLAEAEIANHVDYTNVHYTLLGRVIEAVSGQSWRDFLEQRLFLPAGMSRTTAYASRLWADPNHADPLEREADGWKPILQRKSDRTMHAAGGLATTAVDGARWLQLFLGHGSIDGVEILPPEVVDRMLAVQSRFAEPDGSIRVIEGFGSAWQVGTFNGRPFAAHGGGYTGASAYCAMLPADDVGVFVLANAGGPAQGLGTIAAIDVLERLSGTSSPWSVHDSYVERMGEMKARQAQAPSAAKDASAANLPVGALSRAAGLYEGTFRNPWWGTVTASLEGQGLVMRLGDTPMEVEPVDGASDQFRVTGLFDDPAEGRFVIEPNGTVERLILSHPVRGDLIFER